MISISKLAASIIFETLKKSRIQSGRALRLNRENNKFILELDVPTSRDRVVRYEGKIVLIVDKTTEYEIGNARIDVEEDEGGRDLVMRRQAKPAKIEHRYI
jgi:hypothetical protein